MKFVRLLAGMQLWFYYSRHLTSVTHERTIRPRKILFFP